jgi:hypothetical protein
LVRKYTLGEFKKLPLDVISEVFDNFGEFLDMRGYQVESI